MRIKIQSGSKSRNYLTRQGTAYVTIGARSDCDIVIEEPGVSDLHLKLERFMDRWSFTDQMSDTGTEHNGEGKYSGDLAEGDRLKVGNTTLLVSSLEEEKNEAKAAFSDSGWKQEIRVSETKAATREYGKTAGDQYNVSKGDYKNDPNSTEYISKRELEVHRQFHGVVQDVVRKPGKTGPKGANPAAKFVPALIVFAIIATVFATTIFPELFGDDQPKDTPTRSKAAYNAYEADLPPGETAGTPSRNLISSDMRAAFKARLDALWDHANKEPPVEKLAQFRALETEVNGYDNAVLMKYDLERVSVKLLIELRREVEVRYGKDNGDIYDLEKAENFGEALKRLEALDLYLNQTADHTEIARSAEMLKYVEAKRPRLIEGNDWFMGEQMASADEALQRYDYAAAVAVFANLLANAQLTADLKEAFEAEHSSLAELQEKQGKGEGPAVQKPFDRRGDSLPDAPVSELLPKGDDSAYPAMNALKARLATVWKDGEIDNVDCTVHGCAARLQPRGEDWRMGLRVIHETQAGGRIYYTVRFVQHQLPPETTISLYETINPTRDELLAMLLICFNEGLVGDAQRIACKLWKADETVKGDLDQLLATKLRIEVPEGGFLEKDGRLVVPE